MKVEGGDLPAGRGVGQPYAIENSYCIKRKYGIFVARIGVTPEFGWTCKVAEVDLELVALGRAAVDLYGQQYGGRLEEMSSFAKYLGGSPANTVVGASRLGLKTGMISRVGNDPMGRFVREKLASEGVDVAGVVSDPDRLTALAILGICGEGNYPLLFYRQDCADMALSAGDIDAEWLGGAGALLISGTHLSTPSTCEASLAAIRIAKAAGRRVAFDIDYRPVLWGLAKPENGEDRFVESSEVTERLAAVLPFCDLIVGTEEEIRILGGGADTLQSLRSIRASSRALIVCKRGAMGCIAYAGEIGDDLASGLVGHGFPIEEFNVLGAGDAFMGGFLRGWLRNEPLETCCAWANACGAIVVSRHGCCPASPSWEELQLFLSRSDWPFRLREAFELEQLHWSTNRHPEWPELMVLAVDHRSQMEAIVAGAGADEALIPKFKSLALAAMERVGDEGGKFGILVDGRYGFEVLEKTQGKPFWVGRPIELPGSRPIVFEGADDVAVTLNEWPASHVVKCLVFYHPDDPAALKAAQDDQIRRVFTACRASGHELLLEIIASKDGAVDATTISRTIRHIYDLGVYPDWWKLEPATDQFAWGHIQDAIQQHDPHCRGIVLLGLNAPISELLASFRAVASFPLVRGFAVGRSIWHDVAQDWFSGKIDDDLAIDQMAMNFSNLVQGWRECRRQAAA